MLRRFLPSFEVSLWGGATITDPASDREEVRGGCLCIQWLGLMIEIGIGRVFGR